APAYALSEASYGKSLQHYRIKSHARQCNSPPGHGEEKRRRGPARDQERSAHVWPEPACAARLGTGAEEVRAHPRHRARDEDAEQERCLRHVEKGRAGAGVISWIVAHASRASGLCVAPN